MILLFVMKYVWSIFFLSFLLPSLFLKFFSVFSIGQFLYPLHCFEYVHMIVPGIMYGKMLHPSFITQYLCIIF